MDCNSLSNPVNPEPQQPDMNCMPCTAQQQFTGLNAFGKGGKPTMKCLNCDGDHPARMCPIPLKPEVAAKIKQYEAKGNGKGGGWRPSPNANKGKGEDTKGGGKGWKGKGKVGMNALGAGDA